MESYRRSFLKMAAISGGAEAMLQLASLCVETEKKNSCPDYQTLDKVL